MIWAEQAYVDGEVANDVLLEIARGRFVSPRDSVTFEYAQPIGCVMDVRGVFQLLAVATNFSTWPVNSLLPAGFTPRRWTTWRKRPE